MIRIGDLSAGHDNNFNLLRMLAATGVLVSHAYPISLGAGAVEPLESLLKGTSLGGICVMIFFAISGFFISRSFAGKSSLKSFLRARALRLFPALAVVAGGNYPRHCGTDHGQSGNLLGGGARILLAQRNSLLPEIRVAGCLRDQSLRRGHQRFALDVKP